MMINKSNSICQSHPTSPPTCQSHPTSPPTCQSHLTSPLTCQSHLTSPLTCQSHLTSPLTCQSHLTSPLICQSHLTSPLSHWLLMDLALRSLPWFHLRSTALLDYALCEASGSRSLGGGGSVTNLVATHHTSTAHHLSTASPIIHCTHTFPSTITPITQLSPFTNQP